MSSLSLRNGGNAKDPSHPAWKPSAFRPWVLLTAALLCWALIILLQLLLIRSQRDGGIILTTDTANLPFSQTFLYLYLPTIVAILFSIFWSWLDLQVKRLEPYYQLSKPGGAKGKDSLLLQYPFDFIPFVPFSALKHRHWAVFWASTAIVVVTWGLVPVQAGLFATDTIVKTTNDTILLSAGFVPADVQNVTISNRYSHSAHGIIWLNETLPPYMTRDYVLAPFRPKNETAISNVQASTTGLQKNETWTAATELYSVDVSCEPAGRKQDFSTPTFTSTSGCKFSWGMSTQFGNDTIGGRNALDSNRNLTGPNVLDVKEFGAAYVGFYSTAFASYYLKDDCPPEANHTFLVVFARNKKRSEDSPNNATFLYCEAKYYMKDVVATVDAVTRAPLKIVEQNEGVKRPLPPNLFNSELFERLLHNDVLPSSSNQGQLPTFGVPSQRERLSTTQISLAGSGSQGEQMVGLAVGAANRPLEELLEPEGLRQAYQAAYRVMFAREMVEILDQEFLKVKEVGGDKEYSVGVVMLVPAFVYVVEALLGVLSICAIALLVIAMKRRWCLYSDPATIGAVMSLVADNELLLAEFSKLDCTAMENLNCCWKERMYMLRFEGQGITIAEVPDTDTQNSSTCDHTPRAGVSTTDIPKPVRPKEFRSIVVVSFIALQIGLAVGLAFLWTKAQPNGLPRPSNNAIIRQIITNYIPTAIATFIEPVWVLLNRLLCMLQPLEELRKGRALPQRSIEADYSSLPPQLVIAKALGNTHFKLAAVCLMALLANVLAVAFSGLFDERATLVPQSGNFYPPFEAKFVSINGSVGPVVDANTRPSGAFRGGDGTDQFLAADSNYTSHTPLPPWTDERRLYVPFMDEKSLNNSETMFMARTKAFGAALDCFEIPSSDYTAEMTLSKLSLELSNYTWKFTMPYQGGRKVSCAVDTSNTYQKVNINVGPTQNGQRPICEAKPTALELAIKFDSWKNATDEENRFCEETMVLGWARDSGKNKNCNDTTSFFKKRLDGSNALFVGCRPRFILGEANVVVNSEGRVQSATDVQVKRELSQEDVQRHFTNDVSNLLNQARLYFFPTVTAAWHSDSYAGNLDFVNYFLGKQGNDSRLLDPTLPPPTFNDVMLRLDPVYSKLFAIWLGINKENLLIPASDAPVPSVQGNWRELEMRVHISPALFIISETILGIYMVVATIIYVWRPGRFLPRLPTSIAAVIGLFAASSVVTDLRNTSYLTKKGRRKRLETSVGRFGYGTFVGTDGSLHVGIEKAALVDVTPLPGVMEKVKSGVSQRSAKLRGTSRRDVERQ